MTTAARGGTKFGPATLASALLPLLLGGCVTAGSLEPAEPPPRSWDDFAATAAPAATPTTTTTGTTAATSRSQTSTRPTSSRTAVAPAAAPTTTTPAARPAWRTALDVADRRSDLGLTEGRAYADLVRLNIAHDGENARLTVTVAGAIPKRLAEGEVVGIGIDLFRTDTRESDYQVFVDGGADGWRVFLHTPHGIVRFPGTFHVVDRQFVVELPWLSLGGRSTADVSAFADWSLRGTIPESTKDGLPDSGTKRMTVT